MRWRGASSTRARAHGAERKWREARNPARLRGHLDHLLPGRSRRGALPRNRLRLVLQELGYPVERGRTLVTPHGFRSSVGENNAGLLRPLRSAQECRFRRLNASFYDLKSAT